MRKIDKKNVEDIIALTPLQEGILFHYLEKPKDDLYFEQLSLVIEGELNIPCVKKAWNFVVKNNEMLRCVFFWDSVEKPVQIILKINNTPIIVKDWSEPDKGPKGKQTRNIITDDIIKKFDLHEVPLRVTLGRIARNRYKMTISHHHILYDGWSSGIIIKEFFKAYDELVRERALTKTIKGKFKEYANWLRTRDVSRQEQYWKNYLEGVDAKTELPLIKKVGAAPTHGHVENYHRRLPTGLERKIEGFTREKWLTLASLLYTAWGILLQKYNCTNDVIFGTTTAGRSAKIKGIENMVGLFINTIPLRIKTGPNETFFNLINRINHTLPERGKYESTSLADIARYSGITRGSEVKLFDSIVVLENYPLDNRLIQENSRFSILSYSLVEKPHYDLTIVINTFDGIELRFVYNEALFDKEAIEKLSRRFEGIIGGIVNNPHKQIKDMEILLEEEKDKILYEFNQTSAEYPGDKIIHQYFEQQVERDPGYIAAVAMENGKRHISYLELNKRVNQLAGVLREKGVEPGNIVGIMVIRSLEMVIGILAILKAGAAYLPIEPGCPPERLKYISNDSGIKLLLTDHKSKKYPGKICKQLNLEDKSLYGGETPNPTIVNKQGDLAYVIYTSGSTGNPKGVMVEHRSLLNLLFTLFKEYPFSKKDVYLLKTSYTFDVSISELFGWLIGGGKLFVLEEGGEKDPPKILDSIEKMMVTHINFVPSMFSVFVEVLHAGNISQLSPLKYIFLAGETLWPELIRKFRDLGTGIRLENLYGPTEGTIYASKFSLRQWHGRGSIPIGRPLRNTELYIVDRYNHLQAPGAKGELCISGEGVAQGYLNRPELTARKFIAHPFKKGKCLYKTGDITRWMEDGNIEFFGRMDHQVKIRGFRVELGEIENQLLKHPNIKKAVVVVSTARETNDSEYTRDENKAGEKSLWAYIVADRQLSLLELREWAAQKLAAYMVPAYFTLLEKLPLTPNGKVDYKALSNSGAAVLASPIEYVPPANTIEKILVKTWQNLLGNDNINVNDNFFEVGGDSIKAIQITSIMHREGYKVTVGSIFKYPTIYKLAGKVEKLKRVADQSTATGIVPLTPIQKLFFDKNRISPNHFNQAFILVAPQRERFDEAAIGAVFKKIQDHHDALRMSFRREKGKIVQVNHGLDYPLSLEVHDFRNYKNEKEKLKIKVHEIQTSIDIETGPLMKLGLFRLKDGDRLLIVIHHLVVDGLSWRILFEDIETLYNQYKNGETLHLPLKSDSFKTWSKKLYDYSTSKLLLKEKAYWAKLQASSVPRVQKDFENTKNLVSDVETCSFCLEEEHTGLLLNKVHQAFGTEINGILLNAVGLAFKKSFGIETLVVALEGHGREEISKDIDISRAVGWFTSLYPVLLDFSGKNDPDRQIKEIKETLHRIPNHGIGYGILKYLTPMEFRTNLEFEIEPQISFNYLGQFDIDINKMSLGTLAEWREDTESKDIRREYELEISGIIINHQLRMTIRYNKKQYRAETIRRLWNQYLLELRAIILYCSNKKEKVLTPVDLTYKELPIETLDRLSRRYSIEDIYLLAPMQEGLLFHALCYPTSDTYFVQTSYRYYGPVHQEFVEKSLAELLKRHDVLRSVFVHEEGDQPIQVVLKNRSAVVYREDIRDIGAKEEREAFITTFKDKNRRHLFDLSRDVMIRLTVIRVDEAEYEFLWSNPHIVMDGWSKVILLREFFEIYNSFLEKRPPQLAPVKPYRTYIEWLGNQDRKRLEQYWQRYLDGYNKPAGIPGANRKNARAGNAPYKDEEVVCLFEKEQTDGLKKFSWKKQVTLNTIIQAIWAIILGRYNETQDVVIGTVVSGRPSDIEGIESMVGLFINTIPLRIRFEEETKLLDLLHRIQEEALASETYHFLPLAEIQSQSPLKQNLLDHIFAYENYPMAHQTKEMALEVNEEFHECSDYNFNVLVEQDDRLRITFSYNANVYDRDFVEEIADQMNHIVDQVINRDNMRIRDIQISHDFLEVNVNILQEEEGDFQF